MPKKEALRREVTIQVRFIAFLLIVVSIVCGIFAAVKSAQVRRLQAEAAEVQTLVLEAKAKSEELQRRLAFTETDEYIAQEARQRFGYMEEGEIRFVLEGSAAANAPQPLIVQTPTPAPSPTPEETNAPVSTVAP